MSYGEIRDREQFQRLDARISDFVARFYAMDGVETRRTVILFPGGLGSRLLRGRWRYDVATFFSQYTAWLDPMFLDPIAIPASDLQMRSDLDEQRRLVVPDGSIDFPPFFQPYGGFTQWCDVNKLDWFVFGWDWRRRIEPTVDFFLDTFLDWFRQRVIELCRHDPLQNLTLIGHSFGGLVVKLIVNRHTNPYVRQLKQAVTVGSPFYGYGGQVRRFFEGQALLNDLKGKAAVIRTISSMPGPYALMFLDHETFIANEAALAADPDYPLSQYPSMDHANPAVFADPYNPLTNADRVRYPQNYLFSMGDLIAAKATCRDITARLAPSIEPKFFNIRAVQHDGTQDSQATAVSQTWKWIRPEFDVENEADEMPITDTMGPGDSVIPAWSARLASTPAGNVRTLKGNIEHMMMMNHCAVHEEVAGIMGLTNPRHVPQPPCNAAGPSEAKTFLGGLGAVSRTYAAASEDERRRAVSNYLAPLSREERGRLLARIYLDGLKAPSQG
jgi:pimeloyl-ACP methyl ester carboxylesterase